MINFTEIIGWVGNIFLILGFVLIARKNIWGMIFTLLGNLSYLIMGLMVPLYNIIALETVMVIISVYGIYNWRKK